MPKFLRIAAWNANGLANHRQEIEIFLNENKIDMLLISESHFTERSYFKLKNYTLYDTKHPSGNAHGGTAILIKSTIKHQEQEAVQEQDIQATTVQIMDWSGPITISAIYCPPRFKIDKKRFETYFKSLGNRYMVGGDYNAKHTQWGSRLITPRGRELLKAVTSLQLETISTGEPTYWPTDLTKTPDVIDIFITKGIPSTNCIIESSHELSSDHTPIIITVGNKIILQSSPASLTNRKTNWNLYRKQISMKTNIRLPLKSADHIDEATEYIIQNIQEAAWTATPQLRYTQGCVKYPKVLLNKIAEKRRLRRIWHTSKYPEDRTNYNRATRQLKRLLNEFNNNRFQDFITNLTPTEDTNYSLFKATGKLKKPTKSNPPIRDENKSWARNPTEKASTFAKFFANVFQTHPIINTNQEQQIRDYLNSPNQMTLPIPHFTPREITKTINSLSNKKAPGYDLITTPLLKELPRKGKTIITALFNSIIRTGHYPEQWKVAQIQVFLKPGKPPHEPSSYRPISILPILSKVFEKLLLSRLRPHIATNNLVPDHQFGFRQQHSTVEQVNRITNYIENCFQEKKYCSAAFLDIAQAFDKVWHDGLLFKVKNFLPYPFFNIIRSFLSHRTFQIKYQNELSEFHPIKAGVPQGSVLGPILYQLYTTDIPKSDKTTIATFADDTAILASDDDPNVASRHLQEHLIMIEDWAKKWKIKINENKSVHITFTLRKNKCPTVHINNNPIVQVESVKYLGIHLDKRLTWKHHILAKKKHLQFQIRKLYWILGYHSKLSLENKLLIYKAIIIPIWTYGIQIWGTASKSNLSIIQRFQSKTLRMIAAAPWFITNAALHKDLKMPTVLERIEFISSNYLQRLENHPNHLALNILDNSADIHRLTRTSPLQLPYRFSTNN